MQTIVLDDHGHAWDHGSSALRHLLRSPIPDFDFLAHLINDLGFVTVTLLSPGSVRIRMRFETAAPASVAAAIYLLSDIGTERVVISHPDDGVDRLFSSISRAVAYIDQRLAEPRWQAAATVQSRQLPAQTLFSGKGPLAAALSLWIRSAETCDLMTLKRLLPAAATGRFMAVEPVEGRLTIVDLGCGFDSFSKAWQENALGMPIEEQPDYDYGRWVQRMYGKVLETGQPRLDDIDATIRRPHMNDKVRVCYRRLILPFARGTHGVPLLVGLSAVTQSIGLSGSSSRQSTQ
jgi:hypothetical protein